jgi:glutamate synthase (NADPH/NADH) small chain
VVPGPVPSAPVHPGVLIGNLDDVNPGFGSWDQALTEARRCLHCPDPTCVRGCPAHNDIPSFISALLDHDLTGAHDILRRTSVLPDVCSRVCDQAAQCEGACTWSLAGGAPVAIGKLERFVTDHAPVPPPTRRSARGTGLCAAVVGAGPAGIGAAWTLAESGASVTVYEKEPAPGGVLGWGIPHFILPADIAARPWRQLTAAGVDLRCGVDIRAEDIGRLRTEHDAVILAHGAALPLWLPVPGADLAGVTDATSFLKSGKVALANTGTGGFLASLGLPIPPERRGIGPPLVLVFGAGDTAMDVARTARRLGLRAVCVARRSERFARARPGELAEARAEGVAFRFLRTVTSLEGAGGRVRRAVLTRTRQGRAGQRPNLVRHDNEILDVDLVVMALGYRSDPALATALPGTPVAKEPKGIPDRRWLASGVLAGKARAFAHHEPVGLLALGREAGLAASAVPFRERLWAAGDALVGPSTVAEAMAQGRRAASAVLAARLCPAHHGAVVGAQAPATVPPSPTRTGKRSSWSTTSPPC